MKVVYFCSSSNIFFNFCSKELKLFCEPYGWQIGGLVLAVCAHKLQQVLTGMEEQTNRQTLFYRVVVNKEEIK